MEGLSSANINRLSLYREFREISFKNYSVKRICEARNAQALINQKLSVNVKIHRLKGARGFELSQSAVLKLVKRIDIVLLCSS